MATPAALPAPVTVSVNHDSVWTVHMPPPLRIEPHREEGGGERVKLLSHHCTTGRHTLKKALITAAERVQLQFSLRIKYGADHPVAWY